MSEHEEMITQFCDVTGIEAERAKFYLEASNWELAAALSAFYEGENEAMADAPSVPTPPAAVSDSDDDEMDDKPLSELKAGEASKSKKSKASSKFATLSHLKSSDEDEEQGQAFYAGGSTTSGQQVLGPPKKNPIKDYVSDIFKLAQEGNMETFEPEPSSSAGSSGGGRLYFGTGYRLGQTPDDQVVVKGPPKPANKMDSDDDEEDLVVLKLWKEGFSVDDGDLKRYDDPVNKEFFESIRRGEIPKELRKKGEKIHVDFEDHRNENYVQPKRKFKAFIGSGNMLGSPAPDVTSNTASTVAAPVAASADSNAENEQRANSALNIDQTQPTTMIQIRLSDGSRLSARFNLTHTVDNIRQYVITARPQYSSQTFMLLTTFPSKELTDGAQTVEQAGLKNAAILQRLK